jgi:hypothetical protein
MNYLAIGVIILVALIIAYFKLKDLVFKAKDAFSVKEDEALKKKQDNLDTQITELKKKMNQPVDELNPEQVEVYWNGEKK